jgi:ribosomal RNA assembly protein
MQEMYSEFSRKIAQNRKTLERELKVKITNRGNLIFVDGKAEDEYIACEVIEAINLGFIIKKALLITNEEFILEKIHIKDLTKRTDLERIRGRIIGTKGRTKKTIENISDCLISVHDNTVGIIGRADEIEPTLTAITALIKGKKQTKTYSYLERERSKDKTKLNVDLGLKE